MFIIFTIGEKKITRANFPSTQNSYHSYHSRQNRRTAGFASIGGYDT
jgi:hypothetical protein